MIASLGRAALCTLWLLVSIHAQPPGRHYSKVDVPGSLVPEALALADRALAAEDWDGAISRYQYLLDSLADQVDPRARGSASDAGSRPVMPGDVFSGVRELAERRIQDLPPAGRERYLEKTEPLAARLLASALARRSKRDLQQLAIRYFIVPSGRRAAFSLVDLQLEAGRLEEARMQACALARDLARVAPKHVPAANARIGVALFGLGRHAALRRLIASASGDPDGKTVLRVGEAKTSLATFLQDLLRRMKRTRPKPVPPPTIKTLNHRMWDLKTARLTEHSDSFYGWNTALRPWFDHFPIVPLISGGVVYTCDGLRLSARSLFTGQAVWPDVQAPVRRRQGIDNRSLFFELALDDDLLFAYLEDEPLMRKQRAMGAYAPVEAIPTRKLLAVDAATGRVVWNLARPSGDTPEAEEFLSGLTVNTPPLPRGDRLFVGGSFHRGTFRHWICCLDKRTGHLIWRTYIGEGQMELNMFGNPIKEAVPGHLAEHEGTLFYCTNLGTVAAVDAATGLTRWISAYDQQPIPSTRTQIIKERYPGWMPSRPAVWNDRVFVAPSDSYDLYAFDIATGASQPVRAVRRSVRNRNRYFLGIHQGLLLTAGDVVTAVDPDRLDVAWRSTRPFGRGVQREGTLHGRPTIAAGRIFFTTEDPAESAWAFEVDIRSGLTVSDLRLLRVSEGNLTAGEDAMTVSARDTTWVFMNLNATERRLATAVQKSPRDPELRLRLGDIHRQKDQLAKALKQFEKALDLSKALGRNGRQVAERASRALYHTWLDIADRTGVRFPDVPQSTRKRYERALAFAADDRQRTNALVRSMGASREADDHAALLQAARALLDAHADEPILITQRLAELVPDGSLEPGKRTTAGVLATVAAGHQCALRRQNENAVDFFQEGLVRFPKRNIGGKTVWNYCGEQIAAILRGSGSRAYQKHERAARRLFKKGSQGNDLAALRTVLDRYPQSSVVEKAWLQLSRKLLESGAFEEALRELQRFLGRGAVVTAPILVQAIRCMESLKAWESSYEIMRILASRFPTSTVVDADGRMQAGAWVRERLARNPYDAIMAAPTPPVLEPKLVSKWTWKSPSPGEITRLVTVAGRVPPAARSLVLVHQGGQLIALDARRGRRKWAKDCGSFPRKALWHDGLLVLRAGREVLLLDPANGQERWRHEPEQADLVDVGAGHAKVYLLCRSFTDRAMYVDARDMLTGEQVQMITLGNLANTSLQVTPEHLVVRSYVRTLCLDPITGKQRKSGSIRCTQEYFPPVVNDAGLLILVEGPPRPSSVSRRATVVKGIDPFTGREVWNFNAGDARIEVLAHDGQRLLMRASTKSRASSGRPVTQVRVDLLDTSRGKLICRSTLRAGETVQRASLFGDCMFLKIQRVARRANSTVSFVRAMDARSGTTQWETIPFTGYRMQIQFLPIGSHLLLRKSDRNLRRVSQVAPAGAVFLLDMKSGTTEDVLEFDEAHYVHGNPNLAMVDGRLVVVQRAAVHGFGK